MLQAAGRLAAKFVRCVAIAVVVGMVVAVATRGISLFGLRGGEMPGWAAFWGVLSWQARALFGRGGSTGGPRSG